MLRLAVFLSVLLAHPLRAETPRIVTDIAPVQGLVAMVLGDTTPEAVVPPGADAHGLALKPSQAKALAGADLVVWIGPDLTPALEDALDSLAPDARRLTLTDVAGTLHLPYREARAFGDGLAGHEAGHDAHDHDHDGIDPHLWLSPGNAALWVTEIARVLTEMHPDLAETYRLNAENARDAIAAAEIDARTALAPVADRPLAVYHDAFQYFEAAFGLSVIGAISDSEAAPAGPATLAALRDRLAEDRPACLLAEPGTRQGLIAAVGAEDVPQAALDPMGAALERGAGLYPALIRDMADRIADCVKSAP